jgi:HK97 family phage major capsid protein
VSKYRRNGVFYTSDDNALALRLIKDGNDRYMWQDAVTAGNPDLLFGKPVYLDPNMPDPTDNSVKSVVFGDFSRLYVVRFSRSVEVVRSDEYGFDHDLVTWKGRVRLDGAVVDGAAAGAITTPAS